MIESSWHESTYCMPINTPLINIYDVIIKIVQDAVLWNYGRRLIIQDRRLIVGLNYMFVRRCRSKDNVRELKSTDDQPLN